MDLDRLIKIIHSLNLPTQPPKFGAERYLELMQVDKKTEAGTIRYVLLEKMGKARIQSVPNPIVIETLTNTGAA